MNNKQPFRMTNNKEKKNKKRGLALTVFLHTAAILAALYPFLISAEQPIEPQQIAVEFVEFKKPTAGSSKSRTAKSTKKAKKPTPKKEVKPTPQPKPKPQPKPTPKPKPKPVITTPTPEKTIETAPTKVETPKKTKKPTIPARPKPPTPTEEVAETAEKASEATSDKVSDTNQSGGKGNKDEGDDKGSSDLEGEGKGDDFSGDGLFRRKVIYRADVKKLIKKNGKITVDLCVNRAGNVISAVYNRDLSTIKDKALVDKAVRVTKRYRFEKDYSAAKQQCGRLTFVCKVE